MLVTLQRRDSSTSANRTRPRNASARPRASSESFGFCGDDWSESSRFAAVAFVASWGDLHMALRDREVEWRGRAGAGRRRGRTRPPNETSPAGARSRPAAAGAAHARSSLRRRIRLPRRAARRRGARTAPPRSRRGAGPGGRQRPGRRRTGVVREPREHRGESPRHPQPDQDADGEHRAERDQIRE